MKTVIFRLFFSLLLVNALFYNSVNAQTVLFQSGFEATDPALLYRAGSINTPVQSTTGGNLAAYCGKFTANGKYDGAFVTGTALNFTLNKFYVINAYYKVATCGGSLRIYRSATAGTFANVTSGTLLSTTVTNQVAYTQVTYTFQATATQTAFIGFVSTMNANGCNSANFFIDDISVLEYDSPPCGFYCTTGYTAPLTSYISNLDFNTISRPSGWDGYICTGLQTSVERTQSYNLALTYHNQTTSQKFVAAWIDYNKNGSFSDAGEQVLANTDVTTLAPPVDVVINQNVTIPAGASLGLTKMRVAMVFGTSAQTIPCSPVTTLSDYEDYDIEINPAPTPMTYVSSTCTQANTTPVNAGTYTNEIIGLQVVTSGTLTPLSATSFTFSTTGTSNAVNDILNAQLWYSSNSATFAASAQVGTTVANPNGTFTFTAPVQLLNGINYFWLTYDIKSGATSPDVVDATCTSVTVGTPRTPTVTAPAGNRPIITATPMVYVSGTVTQNVSRSPRPDTDHQIIGIEIVTNGAGSPLQATSFTFNTTGTSAPVTTNIANARLWSTGGSSGFATNIQVGATVAAPNGVFTIMPAVTLLNGKNYFWLTYDIPAGAGCDPTQADAQCTSYTIGGTPYTPTVTSPLGAVVIDCNAAYYSKGSLPANIPGNWNSKRDGTGTNATVFGSGSSFYVQDGHTMTTTAAVTIPYLTVEAGGMVKASFLVSCTDLRINSYGTFEQIVQATNGAYIANFYIENYGTWIHNNAGYLPDGNRYFSPRSNQWFYQWGGGTFPAGTSWGNVLLNGTTTGNFGMGGVLTTIQGDFEWRRIGNNNYLLDEQNETIDIGGNLIFSGGWWKVAYDNSVPGNQTRSVVINVAGDFIMSSGKLEDYTRGSNASGATLNINGNVTITGGTMNFNLSPGGASPVNLTVGAPTVNWSQTGGTVTLGNTNIKTGKTVMLTGNKMGDVASARTISVEAGAKLYCGNFPVSGAGNFTLQNTAWLGIGSAAGITSAGATGNIQVAGTRSYNSGATYEYYEGLTPQATGNFITTTTSSVYPSQVANLVINKSINSNLVNLTNTTDVTTLLTLSKGILNTSLVAATAPWVRIPSTAAVFPAGGSVDSYVDGYIRKSGTSAFIFPTGNNGLWRRVAVTAPSASTEFEARYVAAPYTNTTTMAASPPTVLDHVSQVEHWMVSKPLGADAATAKVQLFWEDASFSIIYKFDSLAVARWSGTGWENANCYVSCPSNWISSTPQRTYTGVASGTGAGTIQSNTVSTFSPFTFSSVGIFELNPLPVQLLDFNGDCKDDVVKLNWSTATETSSDYFTIEKSLDGKDFTVAGTVNSAGNSVGIRNYSFNDRDVTSATTYYRLRQTDIDGKSKELKVIGVECLKKGPIVFAYNDQAGNLVVTVESTVNDSYTIQIYDAIGKKLFAKNMNVESGINNVKLNMPKISTGIYFISVSNGSQTTSEKIYIK